MNFVSTSVLLTFMLMLFLCFSSCSQGTFRESCTLPTSSKVLFTFVLHLFHRLYPYPPPPPHIHTPCRVPSCILVIAFVSLVAFVHRDPLPVSIIPAASHILILFYSFPLFLLWHHNAPWPGVSPPSPMSFFQNVSMFPIHFYASWPSPNPSSVLNADFSDFSGHLYVLMVLTWAIYNYGHHGFPVFYLDEPSERIYI